MWLRILMCVLLVAGIPSMCDAKEARVEAIQAEAWVTRDGNRTPLKRGAELKEKDQIETGPGARLLLRLPEGSAVKLGENAQLVIQNLQFTKTGKGLLSGALSVIRGAFRFTTDAARKFRGERDLKVSFTTITAGIRGPDLWGKSMDDREVVMLIEGKVTITRANEPPVEMSEPLTVYTAPKDQPANAPTPAEAEQITRWAAETEIGDVTPKSKAPAKSRKKAKESAKHSEGNSAEPSGRKSGARGDGQYFVAVAEYPTEDAALALYDRLRAAGLKAAIRPKTTDTGHTYRVRVIGYAAAAEAEAAAAQIKTLLPEMQPQVVH